MEIVIEKKNLVELARLYKINILTFKKWIDPHKKKIGLLVGRFYNPKQVRIILQLLGLPDGKKYNRTYFSRLCKVKYETFNKWIEPFKNKIGDITSKIFTPKQALIIMQLLGYK